MAKAWMWGTKARTGSGERELCISLRRRKWVSLWWKNRADGPINRSLLCGYVGLKRWACVTRMNRAASGVANITHGHPWMWVLNISPYLYETIIEFKVSVFVLNLNTCKRSRGGKSTFFAFQGKRRLDVGNKNERFPRLKANPLNPEGVCW